MHSKVRNRLYSREAGKVVDLRIVSDEGVLSSFGVRLFFGHWREISADEKTGEARIVTILNYIEKELIANLSQSRRSEHTSRIYEESVSNIESVIILNLRFMICQGSIGFQVRLTNKFVKYKQ